MLYHVSQLLKNYEFTAPKLDGKQDSSLTFTKGVANSADDSDPNHITFVHATNVMLSLW